ncbi:hypothetical protein M4578_23625 [Salipiger sp. P9]|uniref:hypothetical protein n=1 Tax=Salipiger pentaromativorans TaxID=2943193 RepID=UPI00215829C1|nr:hypothetical protein [Salipiger pentaromativorans]MCR8550826.1 hypothetical protein [Salipiger pentaromativorans]
MRHVTFLALLLAVACDMAGPGFRGVPPVKREIEGSRFTIRVRDRMAEVIRTSPEFPARFDPIAARAKRAVFLETGCEPMWVTGDPAMMVMGLSCKGEPAPKQPRRRMVSCEIFGAYYSDRLGGSASMDCTEY